MSPHLNFFVSWWERGRGVWNEMAQYGYFVMVRNDYQMRGGGRGGGNTAYSQTVHVRCLRWFWFNFFAKNINLHHHFLMCGKTATRPLGHTHCHWLKHVNINLVKLLHLSHFSLPYTLFEGCGALYIYHEFQDILHTRENSRKVKMKYLIHTSGPSFSKGG